VDLFAETLARLPERLDEGELWAEALRLGCRLLELHKEQKGQMSNWYLAEGVRVTPQFILASRVTQIAVHNEGLIFIRGLELSLRGPFKGLSVSSGATRTKTIQCSVLLAAGDVDTDIASNAIIVSDGDVIIRGGAEASLIIARGTVTFQSGILGCRVVSGKSVVFANGAGKGQDCAIVENDPTPLGFVQFFDPAREGIAVEPAEGGVRVSDADAAKPFAKAGLRQGDLIVSLGGVPVGSPEEFRRALRAKLAEDATIPFHVRRDGHLMEFRVAWPTP
jgi:hypothetical protein